MTAPTMTPQETSPEKLQLRNQRPLKDVESIFWIGGSSPASQVALGCSHLTAFTALAYIAKGHGQLVYHD